MASVTIVTNYQKYRKVKLKNPANKRYFLIEPDVLGADKSTVVVVEFPTRTREALITEFRANILSISFFLSNSKCDAGHDLADLIFVIGSCQFINAKLSQSANDVCVAIPAHPSVSVRASCPQAVCVPHELFDARHLPHPSKLLVVAG
jgi:hypothetical protein